MNIINADDFETAYDAYKSGKTHTWFVNEPTTIICNDEQYAEIIEATSDEDCEGYAEIEGGADIWGVTRCSAGESEFRIYLKVYND